MIPGDQQVQVAHKSSSCHIRLCQVRARAHLKEHGNHISWNRPRSRPVRTGVAVSQAVGGTSKSRSRFHSPPLASRVVVPPMGRPRMAASKAWKSCTVRGAPPQWQSGGLPFGSCDAPPSSKNNRRPAHRVANSLPRANLKRHLLPHTLLTVDWRQRIHVPGATGAADASACACMHMGARASQEEPHWFPVLPGVVDSVATLVSTYVVQHDSVSLHRYARCITCCRQAGGAWVLARGAASTGALTLAHTGHKLSGALLLDAAAAPPRSWPRRC